MKPYRCIVNPLSNDSTRAILHHWLPAHFLPEIQIHLAAHLAFAEQDNMSRSDNINWGLEAGAKLGKSKLYNKVCYGYKHDRNGHLVINEDQAKNVRLIFRLYLDGYSILSIINEKPTLHIYKAG
ncbi:MAG: hypothetical protein Q4B73_09095 [Lachnospiraceae bacterium]|nr:hypothetical protein [Lachnospiraceae bacterium]